MSVLTLMNDRDIPDTETNNKLAIAAKNGDEQAKEDLVLSNLKLVAKVISIYKVNPDMREDAFNDGVIGLIRAIQTYDETKGAFSTHAFNWIKSMVRKSFSNMEEVHYNRSFYNKRYRYGKLVEAVGSDQNLSQDELFEFNLTEKDVEDIKTYTREYTSLDAILGDDNSNSVQNYISSDACTEDDVERDELSWTIQQEIDNTLSEKEAFVIKHFYGIGVDQANISEIAKLMAKEFNTPVCTRQNVSQLKVKAENKLKASQSLRELV